MLVAYLSVLCFCVLCRQSPCFVSQMLWQGEMDRMLACFVQWARAVQTLLEGQHFWCDAIDPMTGRPMVSSLQCSVYCPVYECPLPQREMGYLLNLGPRPKTHNAGGHAWAAHLERGHRSGGVPRLRPQRLRRLPSRAASHPRSVIFVNLLSTCAPWHMPATLDDVPAWSCIRWNLRGVCEGSDSRSRAPHEVTQHDEAERCCSVLHTPDSS